MGLSKMPGLGGGFPGMGGGDKSGEKEEDPGPAPMGTYLRNAGSLYPADAVRQITQAVLSTNPDLTPAEARGLAREALRRYPVTG